MTTRHGCESASESVRRAEIGERWHVLLADDDERVLEVLLKEFDGTEYACTTVADGAAAIEALQEERFDVALIDLEMPRKDGFEVLAVMQEQSLGTIPIILTGTGNTPRAVRAMRMGAFDIIEKPCLPEMLQNALHRATQYIMARRQAELMAAERTYTQQQMARLNALKERLLSTGDLGVQLKLITDEIVGIFGADFARVWMIGEGDLCGRGCIHASVTEGPHVCRDRTRCLHLVASSGRYTHIDGDHRRVPLGSYKIGRIASGDEASFITNDVTHDPRVHNHAWAEALGLVSFAGWRLLSPEGSPIGVLALFGKRALSADENQLLADMCSTTSHVLRTGIAVNALRESESKLQAILHGCPILQFAIDREHRVVSWNAPLEQFSGIKEKDILGTTRHWAAFYPEERPCLVDLLVDGAIDQIPRWYGDKCVPSALMKDAYEAETCLPRKGEDERWLYFAAAAIRNAQGIVIGGVETLEDITRRKRAEDELQQSRNELEIRVEERTQALTRANESLLCEIDLRKLTEEELRKAHEEVERLLSSMSSFLIDLGQDLRISRWNAAAENTFGIPWVEAVGKRIDACGIRWDWESVISQIPEWPEVKETVRLSEVRYRRGDGTEGFLNLTVNPLRNESGVFVGCFLLGADTTERRHLESQLVQAQKLEAVGRLAAGIAHEINTPTQYVGDNIEFLQVAYDSLVRLVSVFPAVLRAVHEGSIPPELLSEADELMKRTNMDYLMEQIPRAIEQSLEGVGRIATIVQAMKEFSHPGMAEKTSVDLNQCIRSTVTVSRNEWKYVADLDLDLDDSLPQVLCLPGDFNQTILNMIVNAAHAIGDVVGDGAERKGKITVRTRQEGAWAVIQVADTGSGIPEEIRGRIFDPFFTTKEIGRGTGQGLAIARNVIVDKHGGTISVASEPGKGTVFTILLPIGTQTNAAMPA